MRRQHIDQRTEAKAPGALRHGGQKDARRRRQIERRRMMLAHVIGAESDAVIECDQPQAVFILPVQRIRPVVVLIEDAELHRLERVRHDVPPGQIACWRLFRTAHEECPQVLTPCKWPYTYQGCTYQGC